jgi:leucyl-tRNA synthetase
MRIKARSITDLVACFEKEGNGSVNAHSDEDTPIFTSEEWNEMSTEAQEDLLQKYRLTYLADIEVNWCPELGTVLANDEIVNGVSERGGHPVVRKKMKAMEHANYCLCDRLLQGTINH